MNAPALLCVLALAISLVGVSARGEEKVPAAATPVPAAPAAPAPAPVDPAKVFTPTDLDALRPVVGQAVVIEGTIIASGESKSKTVRYLNFTKNYKESVGLVFFTSKGGDDFALEKLAVWVGKKVRVTGKLGEHAGALQIELEKADQLQEVP